MKAVHYGAGNIGRGFIGLLLSNAGYNVCFVEIDDKLVSELRRAGKYKVSFAGETKDWAEVSGVTAVHGKDIEQAASQVSDADLVTTAVGPNVLARIAGSIAKGIEMRLRSPTPLPLQVIACENAIGGSAQLKQHVYERLDKTLHAMAEQLVSFPNAAVDRIVPLQHHEDPLEVTVEPFYEWIVDRSGLPPGAKEIKGVQYAERLEPYIERKLFTVNTGHCAAAYLGYIHGYSTIRESMADSNIAAQVRHVLKETGDVLVSRHGFDPKEQAAYIEQILQRFRNPYVKDEVVRVGRAPLRKISPDERLVRPALQAFELGKPPLYLTRMIAAALLFRHEDDAEAAELQASITARGVIPTLVRYTGIPQDHPLMAMVLAHYDNFIQHKL